MIFRRIDDKTINCIITPQDLIDNGLQMDDLFERRGAAMEFLKQIIDEAARRENVHITGEHTSMRLTILPDQSLSLTLSDHANPAIDPAVSKLVMDAVKKSMQARGLPNPDGAGSTGSTGSANTRSRRSAAQNKDTDNADGQNVTARQQTWVFRFESMRDVTRSCRFLMDFVDLDTSLYKGKDGEYYLLVSLPEGAGLGREEFERIVLTANEYGELLTGHRTGAALLKEHAECMIPQNAAMLLGRL
ncbi:MAG: adaptor protein MecA [Lachnospiraceae bacterium]|nr:adaptor protein MecA [Lachnospiraceae bacterium]